MASLFTKDLLPSSTEEAIRTFDERYLAAVMAADPGDWANQFVFDTPSPRTTFPLSYVASKYRETKEVTGRAQTMEEGSFDISVVEFDTAFEASWIDLRTNAFAYRQWTSAPSLFVMGERRHVSKELTALLELGTSATSPWDGVAFFSTSHRANKKNNTTTFSNYQSSTKDPATLANITAEIALMKDVRDTNGDRLGVQPDQIWLPPEKFQAVSNLLNQNFISDGTTTITNPYLGKLTPVELVDATDANDWYLVDSKLMSRMPPLAAMRYAADGLGLSFLDENSDHFKTTKKLKAMSHIFYGFGLVFPHAIRLVRGA